MTADPSPSIERLLEALNAGQADVLADAYGEDPVLHIAGNNLISGTFRGRAAIRDALAHEFELLAGATALHGEPPESVLTSDRYQMVFFRVSGERNGNRMDLTYVIAAKVGPDAKYQELWSLCDDQTAYNRFWS